MKYLKNNHYCTHNGCDYTTGITSEVDKEADEKLLLDGGFNQKDKTHCPICKNDSLIFLTK